MLFIIAVTHTRAWLRYSRFLGLGTSLPYLWTQLEVRILMYPSRIFFNVSTGLVVSLVILKQGFNLLKSAWGDLTDAGISRRKQEALKRTLTPLIRTGVLDEPRNLIRVDDLRARRAGSMLFVDLTAKVNANLSVVQTRELEQQITKTMQQAKKEVAEVRVRFEPVFES